jgi:ligand-binding sensor domain-containing protein
MISLVLDHQGVMWALTTDRFLMRLKGSRWEAIGQDWGFPGNPRHGLVDHSGTLWIDTLDHRTFFLREGEKNFHELAGSPDEDLAIGTLDGVIRVVPGPLGTPLGHVDRSGSLGPTITPVAVGVTTSFVYVDSQDVLWGSADRGVFRLKVSKRELRNMGRAADPLQLFSHQDGLTSNRVHSTIEDREGNVWMGTSLGLDRFRQGTVASVVIPSGADDFALLDRNDGGVWATAYGNNSLMHIQDGKVVATRPIQHVISAYRDPSGVIWMGNRGDGKILRWLGDTIREIKVPAPVVGGITKDREGRLWALFAGKGYFRQERDGHWTDIESLGGPPHGALTSFTDSVGRIWFGYQKDRVALLDGEHLTVFTTKDGVGVGDVITIQNRAGNVWIGGARGLQMFDGRSFTSVLPADAKDLTGVSVILTPAGTDCGSAKAAASFIYRKARFEYLRRIRSIASSSGFSTCWMDCRQSYKLHSLPLQRLKAATVSSGSRQSTASYGSTATAFWRITWLRMFRFSL